MKIPSDRKVSKRERRVFFNNRMRGELHAVLNTLDEAEEEGISLEPLEMILWLTKERNLERFNRISTDGMEEAVKRAKGKVSK